MAGLGVWIPEFPTGHSGFFHDARDGRGSTGWGFLSPMVLVISTARNDICGGVCVLAILPKRLSHRCPLPLLHGRLGCDHPHVLVFDALQSERRPSSDAEEIDERKTIFAPPPYQNPLYPVPRYYRSDSDTLLGFLEQGFVNKGEK